MLLLFLYIFRKFKLIISEIARQIVETIFYYEVTLVFKIDPVKSCLNDVMGRLLINSIRHPVHWDSTRQFNRPVCLEKPGELWFWCGWGAVCLSVGEACESARI